MKRAISILIAFVIAMSSALTGFAVYAEEEKESKGINNFIDGIVELTHEYDLEKEFVAPEDDETGQIQAFSARNSEEVTDSTETEYTLQDFQTARLIVRANGNFDKCGALEDVSGFEDFHILQYESPEAAMDAYGQLQKEKNILEVDLDLVCTYCGYESSPDDPDIIPKDEFLNDWSRDRTQSKRLQEYLAKSNIPMKEVIVGVVDTGIDYNHEIFEGRVKRTYFNVSSSGNADDEMDSEAFYHGTTVSSIIVNNSPKNVKVAVYKVGDGENLTVTAISAGLLAAIEKCDIINTSLTSLSDVSLIRKCVLKAYSKNIPVFACVGNSGRIETHAAPANIPECIAVSATDFNNATTFMNTLTLNSDISAPGEHIAVAIPRNRYARFSGTSYSAPCAAALGAILKSTNPEITVDEIDTRLKGTSFDVKRYNESQSSQGRFMNNYHSLWDGVGMIQFCNALGLEKLAAPNEINLKDKVYVGEQTCTITCPDEDAIILYTTDGMYPALENANVYTEPFQITQCTRIRAVAYYADGGYYSDEVETTPRIQYTDSDENFVINSNGIITQYIGNISDLYVPETISGIEVTGFSKGAFNTVIGLTLPETVTEIPVSAFAKNSTIEFVRGEGIVTVKSGAFSQSNIMYVEFPVAECIQDQAFNLAAKFCVGYFPNVKIIEGDAFSYSRIISFYGPEVQEIDDSAFGQCSRLEKVYFPQCTIINEIWGNNGVFDSCSRLVSVEMPLITNLTAYALNDTAILKADFPYIKTIEEKAFYNCFELKYVNMPALLTVPKQAFGSYGVNPIAKPRFFRFDSITQIEKDAFGKYPTARIELSHLETAQSLPQTEGCIISMPSTFRECTEDTKGRNYTVYGTKGTYAEQWANENGHTFIEVSQDTAVLTQLPEKYTDADGVLTADVIGFNRTYQWSANDTNDNTTGTPIPNATGKEFNPADYPAYPYYYCVVTSTDVGYNPIEIRTNVTENTTYQAADYTEYNKAVEQANALNRDNYVDFSKVNEALSVDVSNLPVKDQALVDAQTAAIINAINSLVYKSADYTEYNKAVEQAKSLNRDHYVDFSKVDEALAVDVSGKNITEQAEIDAQTEAITDAINGLELKPVAPPVTNPTEPCDPVKPTEPTVAENSSVPADTQSPEIPKTAGDKLVCISAASLIPFAVCIFTLIRKKKESD
ncbi:MAG: S8 family serine peptidase [Ruminococcaceae bacterium]|nr:S8 family serine peptidase [Oscillospiraceae bacterium]